MKAKDKQLLHTKSITQLQADLVETQKNLAELQLKLKANQLKDTTQLKKTRHQLAVLKTIIHQKQLQPEADQPLTAKAKKK
jgi:ribosomal protein L29